MIGALAGALLFLLSQAGSMMSQGDGTARKTTAERAMAAVATLGEGHPLWLPARAALGNPGAVVLMAALARRQPG
ncbi:hypothetical protein [Massilia sp. Se16.2.3]|uniref:hypothetical protein n=1 Tax=Massilia sp. Se16.2.3 TaxID=2709303 RepID=UPI001E38E0B8|nr:hypothetical protein [Massilia sp. Se16.2.3]